MIEWNSKWNQFNSYKALVHVPYWEQIIKQRNIPPPIFVSVDLSNRCNFNCYMCNAKSILESSTSQMSLDYMIELADFLQKWDVKGICIGGGGESLTNKNAGKFIERCSSNNIKILLITNGSTLNTFPEILLTDYLGISVNAGNETDFERMGMSNSQMFHKVIQNIETIAKKRLHKLPELTYKFLITPINYNSIYEAVKLAKSIGCDQFQARPVGNPWFNLNGTVADFTPEMISSVEEQMQKARFEFEDNNFRIYGITHKFKPDFSINNNFEKCYTGYVTCLFAPNGVVGLCCDRRGDDSLTLCQIEHPEEVLKYWNTQKHFDLVSTINTKKCPRCTTGTINEIFEHIIIKDDMNVNFF